jgi:hypothetical protein
MDADREVCVLNYGLLLLLANAKQEARDGLDLLRALARPVYWDEKARIFRREPAPGLKLMKPTKDDELRRRVIDSALGRAES